MSQPEPNKNFFDTRTILSILLVGGLFFGWQKYLETKYPDYYRNRAQTAATATDPQNPSAPTAGTTAATVPNGATTTPTTAPTDSRPEERISVQMGHVSLLVSSKGMGIHQWTLNNYTDREGKPVVLGQGRDRGLYEITEFQSPAPLHFALTKVSDTVVKGTATSGGAQITQTLTFDPEKDAVRSEIAIASAGATKGFSVHMPETKQHQKDGTFFLPSMEHQEFIVRHQGKLERLNASSKKEEVKGEYDVTTTLALGSQYFVSAFQDHSTVAPNSHVYAPLEGDLVGRLDYAVPAGQDQVAYQWIGYAGPKSITQLQSVDPSLGDLVNFGFFSPIGRVLLTLLKWFHSFIGNWGFSIILLTLMVRLLVMPFNISSYKSMKKMQAIQPALKSIRERYKEDPTALNRETMALMKESKVNPLGGCLPMLLQMPVFFALYQVLGQSIELYQAPFVGWIHDLSLKDPFYILPVLMGITMFLQQKMTPSTMDPAQAKVLQWMPVIFSVFTLSLPAGLTLYIFVSTLFAVIQQQLFMRDRSKALVPASAK